MDRRSDSGEVVSKGKDHHRQTWSMDVLKKNTVCMFITIAVCGFLALGFDTVLLELVQNKFGTERYLFYDTMRVRIRLDSAKRSEDFDLV